MATQNWIPLFEYSSKYNVSLSTLRRRIKNHSILFKLDGGKYYILDEQQEQRAPTPSPPSSPIPQIFAEPIAVTAPPGNYVEASVLTSAHRLVEELKAAYAKILQEKEEQIGLLKEQIVDLNMLVSMLEKQAHRSLDIKETPASSRQTSSELSKGSDLNVEPFYFPEIEV